MLFPHTPEFMQPAGESSPAQHPRTGLRRRLPFARIFATRSARLTIPPARTPTHKTPGLFFTLGVPSVTPLSYTPHLIRRLLLRDNLQTIRKFCFAVSFRVRAKFWTGIDSVREIPPPPLPPAPEWLCFSYINPGRIFIRPLSRNFCEKKYCRVSLLYTK